MANKALPHDIRNAQGHLKYRKGAMVSENEYEAILASHVGEAQTESGIAAQSAPEKMPFVPGAWQGRPPHEVEWQEAHGLAHDQYVATPVAAEDVSAEAPAVATVASPVAPVASSVAPVAAEGDRRGKAVAKAPVAAPVATSAAPVSTPSTQEEGK